MSPQLYLVFLMMMLYASCNVTSQAMATNFTAPWSTEGFQNTDCRLWTDSDSLHFDFDVVDTSLVYLSQDNFHNGIGNSDRVELFFAVDTLLSAYYGMELCLDHRVLDFSGESYRQLDFDWSWPKSALSKTCKITEIGYQCKGSFSLSYLESLGLIQHNKLLIGVFRADYHDALDPHDVTWITARDPKVPNPDFHISATFFQYSLK